MLKKDDKTKQMAYYQVCFLIWSEVFSLMGFGRPG
jgi:hypothetical protein